MNQETIILAYCAENSPIANELESQLSSTGVQFKHFAGNNSLDSATLSEQLLSTDEKLLLIISDNFLKSAQCMGKAIELLQKKSTQILTIVVDGLVEDENTKELKSVQTNFDRVSDIIKYINYWQDQYLELRRKKRQIKDLSESQFNANLKKLRDISSDVGEFLRLLRSMPHIRIEDLRNSQYEQFFRFIGNLSAWDQYKDNAAAQPITQEIPAITSSEPIDEEVAAPSVETAIAKPEIEAEVADEPFEVAPEPEEITTEIPEVQQEDPQEEPEVEEVIEPEEAEAPSQEEEAIKLVKEGLAHFDAGRIDEALKVMAMAVDHNPTDPELRYHYALMLVKDSRDLQEATLQLNQVVEFSPENVEAHKMLGKIADQQQDYLKAKYHYEKVLSIDPEHPGIYYKLGNVVLNNFESEKDLASSYFMQAMKTNPKNPYATYKYAKLLSDFYDNKPKALEYFQKVIEISPDHPTAYYDMAVIHQQLGEYGQAASFYEKATQVNPDLKTEENDLFFSSAVMEEAVQPEIMDFNEDDFNEESTLDLLKRNISRLEQMLTAKKEKKEPEPEPEPEPLPELKDKVVLITGATAGIGKATAIKFAQDNYRVIINGRRTEKLEALKESLESDFHTQIKVLPFDVRDKGAIEAALSSLEPEWTGIDILINNAGKAKGMSPIQSGSFDHWEEMIDTNLKGLLYLTRLVVPSMVAKQSGHIINICSIAGKEVYPNGNVYCATKHAVDALTKAMRIDLYKDNIRVSQVSPAMVEETEFSLVRFDGDEERAKIYDDFNPLKSSDVAEAIHFMATRPAYVNIQDIVMMGTQQASSVHVNRSGRMEEEE